MEFATNEQLIWGEVARKKGVSVNSAKEQVYSEMTGKKIEKAADDDAVYPYIIKEDDSTSREIIFEETLTEEAAVKRISDMISTSTPEDLAKVFTLLVGKQVVAKDGNFMVASFEPVIWECAEIEALNKRNAELNEIIAEQREKFEGIDSVNAELQDTIKKMVAENVSRDSALAEAKVKIIDSLEKSKPDLASPEAMAEVEHAQSLVVTLK